MKYTNFYKIDVEILRGVFTDVKKKVNQDIERADNFVIFESESSHQVFWSQWSTSQ